MLRVFKECHPQISAPQAFSQDLKGIRPDPVPIGGPEGHARCFSVVVSAKVQVHVSKDFQIC